MQKVVCNQEYKKQDKKTKINKKENKVTNNHFNYLFLFQIALFLAVLFK